MMVRVRHNTCHSWLAWKRGKRSITPVSRTSTGESDWSSTVTTASQTQGWNARNWQVLEHPRVSPYSSGGSKPLKEDRLA
ncbi:hypothetical protein GDO81_024426 [Engystomops pustulosus]|uniref:Uncharacterized protein n=1 Tax=Engystomops pustulosus TaxID=76066 RepID=A0AAV6YU33_ENGPU|nr:hypothetical protein GDO81_024426 [Engystomops pustulosus]